MLFNTLKVAFRNLRRQKLYAVVNVTGLAVSIAGALLIYAYLARELSWDDFHRNKHGIYRIITGKIGDEDAWSGTPAPLGPMIAQTYPEIAAFTRADQIEFWISRDGERFQERKLLAVDPTFLNIFSYTILRSAGPDPLSSPNAVVLTESMAAKYFGESDPLGETLTFNDRFDFEVTGIIADVPAESHLQFSALINFEWAFSDYADSWGSYNFFTYVQAAPGVSEASLLEKIRSYSVELEDHAHRSFEHLGLQRLSDIHFEYIRGNIEPVFERRYVFILATIAVIILILGAINYNNIATAMAPARAKEVGIRNVVGSSRTRLVRQFLLESFLQVSIAGLFGFVLAQFVAPHLGRFLDLDLSFDPSNSSILAGVTGLILILGLVSGSFTAFYLSGCRPIDVLRKNLIGKQKTGFRNALVTLQFSLSVLLIAGTFVLLQQVRFLQKADIGLDRELVVNITLGSNGNTAQEQKEALLTVNKGQEFKEALFRHASVQAASVNSYSPGEDSEHWGVEVEGRQDRLGVFVMFVDKDFFSTFEIPFVEGAENVERFAYGNELGFLLNESARAEIGWTEAAGKVINGETVLGVVKDFNFRSLHHSIEPLLIVLTPGGEQISIKMTNQDIPAALAYLEETFRAFYPGQTFEYEFFDDAYRQLYEFEQRSSRAVLFFTILSLIIAGVGLFGLSYFVTVQRTKEVGIRKVMGASVVNIVFRLSRDFARPVIVAALIASPVAWFIAERWLENFAYRIGLGPGVFLLAGFIALLIAVITVSLHAVRAALVNPVETLRYE